MHIPLCRELRDATIAVWLDTGDWLYHAQLVDEDRAPRIEGIGRTPSKATADLEQQLVRETLARATLTKPETGLVSTLRASIAEVNERKAETAKGGA